MNFVIWHANPCIGFLDLRECDGHHGEADRNSAGDRRRPNVLLVLAPASPRSVGRHTKYHSTRINQSESVPTSAIA